MKLNLISISKNNYIYLSNPIINLHKKLSILIDCQPYLFDLTVRTKMVLSMTRFTNNMATIQ